MNKIKNFEMPGTGTVYSSEFEITQAAAGMFGDLTSDRSSLHNDDGFARRSLYRRRPVYGMLPVVNLLLLPLFHIRNARCSIRSLKGSFLRPVFAGDHLRIGAVVTGKDDLPGILETEYSLENIETRETVTRGGCVLVYEEGADHDQCAALTEEPSLNDVPMVERLEEHEYTWRSLQQGMEGSLQCTILREHLYGLYLLLKAGGKEIVPSEWRQWQSGCDASPFLIAAVLSTLTGMRIPGKQSLFLDFSLSFEKMAVPGTSYTVKGIIDGASESTRIVTETVEVLGAEGRRQAAGCIHARLEEEITVPSVQEIKSGALDPRLEGKTVLVTGSSRGIGEATAKLFSACGCRVVINYLAGKEDAERVAAEICSAGAEAYAVRADVSDSEQVRVMFSGIREKFGGVHILVNNAVHDFIPGNFLNLHWHDFQEEIDVTVKGAFNCCREAVPLMKEQGEGRIINISSVLTDVPEALHSEYIVAKSALTGLTRSLAVELAADNILVNMVVASAVRTDLTKGIPYFLFEAGKYSIPLRRNGSPLDIANAAVFLASAQASFITGQRIAVSGGTAPFL